MALEDVLAEVHQVHLVDRDDEVRDPEQRGDEGVAARLRQHAVARVDQDDGEVRRWRRRWPCCACTARGPGVSAMMNLRRGVEK